MFNLIRYGICHPKFLGSFIVEKTWKIVLVLLAFLAILFGTILGLNISNTYLTDTEASQVENVLASKTNFSYKDNKLSFENEVREEIFGIDIVLDHDGVVDNAGFGTTSIILTHENVYVSVNGIIIRSKAYTDFNQYEFNINNPTLKDRINFNAFLEEAFSLSYVVIYSTLTFVQIVEVVFSAMLLFLFIFLLTARLNPQVKGVMRIRLLLSCFISYLFLYWFYYVLDQNTFIYLLTYIIPYLYFIVALGNILRISKVVKE